MACMRKFLYTGSSMRVTFVKGDILFVEPIPIQLVRNGDVVVFLRLNSNGETVCISHRVVLKTSEGVLITRGDNCIDADSDCISAVSYTHLTLPTKRIV